MRDRILLLLAALVLAGCASISVLPVASHPAQRPQKLYVPPFSFAGAEVNVDREGKELADFQAKLAHAMAADIVLRAPKIGLKGEVAQPIDGKPHAAWLVQGRFLRVNQGSRALRSIIGFGAGGTKLEARIEVYDLSTPGQPPFLVFLVTGGSGSFPGGLFNPTVASIAVWTAAGLPQGITDDAQRACRMILAHIGQEMQKQGYLSPSVQAPSTKALKDSDVQRRLRDRDEAATEATPATP